MPLQHRRYTTTTTPLHHYTTTPLHHYTTTPTPLQHYTTATTPRHYNTAATPPPLHHYTTTPLHHYTTTPLHHYTPPLHHHHYTTTTAPPPLHHHRYTTATPPPPLHHRHTTTTTTTTTPLHHYTTTPLHHYTTTPLHHYNHHHYTTTPLHHYTTTPLHQHCYTTTASPPLLHHHHHHCTITTSHHHTTTTPPPLHHHHYTTTATPLQLPAQSLQEDARHSNHSNTAEASSYSCPLRGAESSCNNMRLCVECQGCERIFLCNGCPYVASVLVLCAGVIAPDSWDEAASGGPASKVASVLLSTKDACVKVAMNGKNHRITSSKKKCVGHVFAIFHRRDQQVCVTEEMHQCVHHYFKSFGKTLRISCANVHSKSGGKPSPRPNPNEHPSAHVRHCEIPQWSKAKNMHACVDLKGVAGPFLSSDLTMLSVTYELTPHVRAKQTTGHPDELDQ